MNQNEIEIPEYKMKLMWDKNGIEIYDYLDEKIRDKAEISGISQVKRINFDLYELHISDGEEKSLVIAFLTPLQTLPTKSEYILDFFMKST
ncbi:MAG: hypothetical protein ACTSR2_13960, partial [Candidatus Hodarchaeales archaeon]